MQRPFTLEAAVVLPDHLHCIWTLPPGDADFSTRWRLIKTWFTKHCDWALGAEDGKARTSRGERGLWQHRYWEHMLRDETDYRRHIEYIHFNPVKHGYVKAPMDWPFPVFGVTLKRECIRRIGVAMCRRLKASDGSNGAACRVTLR